MANSKVYETDYFVSRDCFLKLMEIAPSCKYANVLGNIYYYGKCNNGVPEYDKAFYYFSIGAAGGVTESMYMQADMFMNGYGVTKDTDLARDIYTSLYNENLKRFLSGDYKCRFAELALRMAQINETEYVDYEMIYKYYLQAECAIKLRQGVCHLNGDVELAKNIANSVNEYKTALEESEFNVFDYIEDVIGNNTLINRSLTADIKPLGESKYEINIYFEKLEDEENVPCLLVTSIVNNFARLINKAIIQVEGNILSDSGKTEERISVKFDEIMNGTLYYKGQPMFEFNSCDFDLMSPDSKE